jgi:aerobic C4-dicarboxylate transport protein
MKKNKYACPFYFQIIISLMIGLFLGHFYPELAIEMQPLGAVFIKLIRMLVPLIIFSTVVTGVTHLQNVKQAGRIGLKAFIYFEVVTTLAMLIGLAVANYYQPGAGLDMKTHFIDHGSIKNYSTQTGAFHPTTFLLNVIPTTLISAFTQGETLSVLFVSIVFGLSLLQIGEQAKSITQAIEHTAHAFFSMVDLIMKIAPLAVFGAIAYTVGTYGLNSLVTLGRLLGIFYLTCFIFIFGVLGLIARLHQFSLWRFLKHIKEELLIVISTASTEAVLPRMIHKLEKFGCKKSIAGLVLPAGYSFNLDGMCIYLTLAILFIAQAFNIPLTFTQQLTILVVLCFTSKGAANVSGGGFIALAIAVNTLHVVPVEGLALLLGIDRFISEARSLTNLIGNGVATVVIAKWENSFTTQDDITVSTT